MSFGVPGIWLSDAHAYAEKTAFLKPVKDFSKPEQEPPSHCPSDP
jgi:hypothetical protein